MKQKELREFRTKNIKNLNKVLLELQTDLVAKKLDLKMNKFKNIHLVAAVKKNIAIVQTLIGEKIDEVKATSQKEKNGTN